MNERLKSNIAILKQHNLTHEPVYHITDGKKHEVELIHEIVEDCEEIFNDEKQGLLVRLPCKVESKVYHIYTCPLEIAEHTVCGFSIEDGEVIIIDENDNRYNSNELLFSHAEAKKKLKGEK